MKITGIKSICCGNGVKLAPPSKRDGDKYMVCLGCKELCEHYYIAEFEDLKGNKVEGAISDIE